MEKDEKPTITPLENGPLLVAKLTGLEGEDGVIKTDPKTALCRCGMSKNKPFCDGAHADAGFSSERGKNENDERLVFEGDPVTFYENIAICSHAGFCPRGTPGDWRPEDGEQEFTDEELIEKVRKCPSGALSYARGGSEHRDQERPPKIRVKQGGPLEIEGGIELRNTEWGEGASREHYALCRCGASKMKPFCDGSHDEVWADGE